MSPSSPTRVFLDARTIRREMTGVGRYAMGLLRGLAGLEAKGEDVAVRALILPEALEIVRSDPRMTGVSWIALDLDYESHPRGDFGLRWTVPRWVEPGEVYHGPAFTIPGGRQPFARVVSIHDLGVFARPKDYPCRFAAYLRWSIRRAAARADRIVTGTEAMARELARTLRISTERIVAVPDAADLESDRFDADAPAANFPNSCREGTYVVSIGTLEPRKDPLAALGALGELGDGDRGPHWVWIGAAGFQSRRILRRIDRSPVGRRFHHLGFMPTPQRSAVLKRAAALVYPSRYEGFGLPPLEAMAAGVPVVASELPAVSEVCADAALYFPPGDAAALAHQIGRILDDPGLRNDLVRRGLRRAAQFTWERTARGTLEVYRAAPARKKDRN